MFKVGKWSIRQKLRVASMLATSVALLVACGIFAVFDIHQYRKLMVQGMATHARIVADSSTAALSFDNANDARHTLELLHADSQIKAACIYDAEGKMVAEYFRETNDSKNGLRQSPTVKSATAEMCYEFTREDLILASPINLDGRRIGSVFIRASLEELYARMWRIGWTLLAVLTGSAAIAWALISKLQKLITEPIEELGTIARRVSSEKDYGLRARKTTEDELGVLIDCFNEMLAQIQTRDKQLHEHRSILENEVAARTAELTTTNLDLTSARDRAEEASRAKSAFLANMSHEIRTPMTAILGYSDMMLEPASTLSDRQDCLQVIRRNARHLMQLINDILDISKIEAEKMTVEQISTDLPQLVIEAVSMIRPKAMEKELLLAVEFEGPIPRQVFTDPLRLKQILMNLMGNAIKFTTRGSVRLCVACDQTSGVIKFDICDSGIGMTAEQIARLFQPFVQADDSMTRKYGGTGLGLAISKKLALLLGGNITVSSAPRVGSAFTVTVAVGSLEGAEMLIGLSESILAPVETQTQSVQVNLQGRILLAEDGQDNQCLISMHLTRAGAEVVIADNGRIAVDRMQAEPFDVILMDMQMPVLDGYGAASELRERGFKVPIIALTAHAMAGDRERCLAAGCTDYLTKPIDKERLLSVVNAHLVASRKANAASSRISSPASIQSIPAQAARPVENRTIQSGTDGMRELVAGFVGRLPARVKVLHEHLQSGNLQELQRTAHQLKGAGTGYGLPAITQLAAVVEQHVKQGSSSDQIAGAVDALVQLLRSIDGYEQRLEIPNAA